MSCCRPDKRRPPLGRGGWRRVSRWRSSALQRGRVQEMRPERPLELDSCAKPFLSPYFPGFDPSPSQPCCCCCPENFTCPGTGFSACSLGRLVSEARLAQGCPARTRGWVHPASSCKLPCRKCRRRPCLLCGWAWIHTQLMAWPYPYLMCARLPSELLLG